MRLGWACDVPCAPAPLSSQDIVFNVYCASHPSIEDSKRLTFRPFNVAYPHLSAHFASAGLDPLTNTWDTVHDYNAEDPGAEDNFRVEVPDVLTYQELPLDGLGPCENPVLGPSGERYAPAAMDGFEQDDQFQGNFDGAQNEGDFGGFGEEAEAGFGQEEGFGQEGDADAGMEAQGGDAIAHGDATDNGFDDGAAHEETNGPVAVPPAQATFAPAPPDFMRELEAQERERKLQHIEEEKKQREAVRSRPHGGCCKDDAVWARRAHRSPRFVAPDPRAGQGVAAALPERADGDPRGPQEGQPRADGHGGADERAVTGGEGRRARLAGRQRTGSSFPP